MRILQITVRADIGGGPEHLYQLMANLPQDVRCHVACPMDAPYWERFGQLAQVEERIEIPHRALSRSHIAALARHIRREGIGIIHSHGKGAGLYGRALAMLTGRPAIHTFHGLHIGTYGPVKKALYFGLERALGQMTTAGISVSESECRDIAAARLLPARKLTIIENGVHIPDASTLGTLEGSEAPGAKRGPSTISRVSDMRTARSRGAGTAARAPGTGPKLKIVAVSRYNDQKNAELFLPIARRLKARLAAQKREEAQLFRAPTAESWIDDAQEDLRQTVQGSGGGRTSLAYGRPAPLGSPAPAMAERPRSEGVTLTVLGTGPGRAALEDAIAAEGLDDVLILAGSHPDPRVVFRQADLFLSTSRWEGMPLAVLEAMSEGLAVVATDVVGNRDVVDDGVTGRLYPSENAEAAVDAILGLEAEDLDKMGKAGRDFARERYSSQRMAEETHALYRSHYRGKRAR